MTPSMLEEVEAPESHRLIVCPCCMLGFKTLDLFKRHAQAVTTMLEEAVLVETRRKKAAR